MKVDKQLVLKFVFINPSICRIALRGAAVIAAIAGGIGSVQALPTVSVTIDTTKPISAPAITLCGISDEIGATMYGNTETNPNGWRYSATNTELIQLFENAGVQSMRVGGDSADQLEPSTNDIDHYFGFLNAVGIPTVYTLNFDSGSQTLAADHANYIVDTYGQYMDQAGNYNGAGGGDVMWFAIGNEPNLYTDQYSDFNTWLPQWNGFANAVENMNHNNVIWLGGPDSTDGPNGTNWANEFFTEEEANNYAPDTDLVTLTLHFSPLGGVSNRTEYAMARDSLTNMDNGDDFFPKMRDFMSNIITSHVTAPAAYYDFTEFNNCIASSSKNNTNDINDNTFAYGLYALDALNWWAANTLYWKNGCVGLHFHAGVNGFHSAYRDVNGDLYAYPLMYGMAAYTLCLPGSGTGGEGIGKCEPVTVANNQRINVAAYAIGHNEGVSGVCTNLYVTFINKTEDSWKTNVTVNILPTGMTSGNVDVMYFVAKNGSSTEETNITLGGASLNGLGPFQPAWTHAGSLSGGVFTATVTNLTAAIFRIGN